MAEFVSAVAQAVVAPMVQVVVLLADFLEMETVFEARRVARPGVSRCLRRGRKRYREGGILPPSAIVHGE